MLPTVGEVFFYSSVHEFPVKLIATSWGHLRMIVGSMPVCRIPT